MDFRGFEHRLRAPCSLSFWDMGTSVRRLQSGAKLGLQFYVWETEFILASLFIILPFSIGTVNLLLLHHVYRYY